MTTPNIAPFVVYSVLSAALFVWAIVLARRHSDNAGFVILPCLCGLLFYENAVISVSSSHDGKFVDVIKQGRFALDAFIYPAFLVTMFELNYEVHKRRSANFFFITFDQGHRRHAWYSQVVRHSIWIVSFVILLLTIVANSKYISAPHTSILITRFKSKGVDFTSGNLDHVFNYIPFLSVLVFAMYSGLSFWRYGTSISTDVSATPCNPWISIVAGDVALLFMWVFTPTHWHEPYLVNGALILLTAGISQTASLVHINLQDLEVMSRSISLINRKQKQDKRSKSFSGPTPAASDVENTLDAEDRKAVAEPGRGIGFAMGGPVAVVMPKFVPGRNLAMYAAADAGRRLPPHRRTSEASREQRATPLAGPTPTEAPVTSSNPSHRVRFSEDSAAGSSVFTSSVVSLDADAELQAIAAAVVGPPPTSPRKQPIWSRGDVPPLRASFPPYEPTQSAGDELPTSGPSRARSDADAEDGSVGSEDDTEVKAGEESKPSWLGEGALVGLKQPLWLRPSTGSPVLSPSARPSQERVDPAPVAMPVRAQPSAKPADASGVWNPDDSFVVSPLPPHHRHRAGTPSPGVMAAGYTTPSTTQRSKAVSYPLPRSTPAATAAANTTAAKPPQAPNSSQLPPHLRKR